MSSKFKPTKQGNPCVVCGDTTGACREIRDSNSVLCRTEGSTQGWKDLGPAKRNPFWHTFVPSNSSSDDWQTRLEKHTERRVRQEEEERKRRSLLLQIAQRDALARLQVKKLSETHQEGLRKRGISQAWIDYAVTQSWLYEGTFYGEKGFYISAVNLDGLICGSQFARDDRNPKYQWVSKNGSVNLPETGENPLFVWKHPNFDPTQPATVCLTEGALKPLVAACRHWDSTQDFQRIFVGAGSPPGAQSVTLLLSAFTPKETKVLLAPDAGWEDAQPNVKAFWQAWLKPAYKSGWKPTVLWWNQWQKSSPDIDELKGSESIREIGAKSFLDSQGWKRLQKFSANLTTSEDFCSFQEFVQEGSSVFVHAGLGAGKTHEAIELLKRLDRGAIVVTPTNKLGRDFAGRCAKAGLKSVYHLQSEDDRRLLADPQGIVILCPDSLHHVRPQDFQGRILIVDEAEGNWQNFLQRDTAIKRNRREILDRLQAGLNLSWANVLLDGNLSDLGCEFYSSEKNSLKIRHTPTNPKPFNIRFLETLTDTEIFHLAHESILSGKKVVIKSDSLKDLQALKARYGGDRKTRLLCSQKDGEEWQDNPFEGSNGLSGLEDINGFIAQDKTELLLLSPCAGSGLDLNIEEHFDECFQLIRGVLGVNDCEQKLARLRDARCPRTIWAAKQGLPGKIHLSGDTQKEIMEATQDYLALDFEKSLGIASEEDLTEAKERLDTLLESKRKEGPLLYRAKVETENLRAFFLQKLIDSGHDVEIVTHLGEELRDADKDQKRVKRSMAIAFAEETHEAKDLTRKEFLDMSEKESLNAQQRAEVQKFRLLDALPGIDDSPEWNDETPESEKNPIPKSTLFVHKLITGPEISRAMKQVLFHDPESARILAAKRWRGNLERGYIEQIKSDNLFVQTLIDCGLNDVLALDTLTYETPEVVRFIRNCRKAKNRKQLGNLNNQGRILTDLLEQIGYRLNLAKKGKNCRSYKIGCELPESILTATRRKVAQRLAEIDHEKPAKKQPSKQPEPLQEDDFSVGTVAYDSYNINKTAVPVSLDDGLKSIPAPPAPSDSAPSAPTPLQVGSKVLYCGSVYTVQRLGTAFAFLESPSGFEAFAEISSLQECQIAMAS